MPDVIVLGAVEESAKLILSKLKDPTGFSNLDVASLGDVQIGSNQDLPGVIQRYGTLTIDATFTLSVPSSQFGAVILADEIIVNGTISASGRGLAGAPLNGGPNSQGFNGVGDVNAIGGSAGAGGASDANKGGNGGATEAGAGGVGATSSIGGSGVNSRVLNLAGYNIGANSALDNLIGAGGGSGGTSGSNGGAGGDGGGWLIIIAPIITVNGGGAILANGLDGGTGVEFDGGGGGGGGGLLYMSYTDLTETGTLAADGGAGGGDTGTASWAGGPGGDGILIKLK